MNLLEEEVLEAKIAKPKLKYSIKDEIKYILKLFSIQSPSCYEHNLRNHLAGIASKIPNTISEIDSNGNLLITKGYLGEDKYYPCIIAHMDGVFSFRKNYQVKYKSEKNKTILYATADDSYQKTISSFITNNVAIGYGNAGLYGDDKNGIWIALKMLNEIDNIKVVFTVEEEIGGTGARNIELSFFDDVGYIIEGDRRGNSDIVTEITDDICSKEFIDIIKPIYQKYGYSETIGMFTDIDALKSRGLDISCINMSVGYYNPHTINEYTVIEDMFYAAQLISNMINGLGNSKYEHKSEMNGSFGYRGYSSFKYDKYDDYYNDNRHDDYDNYDDYYGRKIPVNRCSCVDSETVNVDCLICNPIYTKHSNKICQCGEELVEHMYSYHCDYCSRVYIKF